MGTAFLVMLKLKPVKAEPIGESETFCVVPDGSGVWWLKDFSAIANHPLFLIEIAKIDMDF